MNGIESNLRLTPQEIAEAFADPIWSQRFPPILTVDQAAELLIVPKATLYDWSSRGLLADCGRRVGKHLRFVRNRLVSKIFNEGLGNDK